MIHHEDKTGRTLFTSASFMRTCDDKFACPSHLPLDAPAPVWFALGAYRRCADERVGPRLEAHSQAKVELARAEEIDGIYIQRFPELSLAGL